MDTGAAEEAEAHCHGTMFKCWEIRISSLQSVIPALPTGIVSFQPALVRIWSMPAEEETVVYLLRIQEQAVLLCIAQTLLAFQGGKVGLFMVASAMVGAAAQEDIWAKEILPHFLPIGTSLPSASRSALPRDSGGVGGGDAATVTRI